MPTRMKFQKLTTRKKACQFNVSVDDISFNSRNNSETLKQFVSRFYFSFISCCAGHSLISVQKFYEDRPRGTPPAGIKRKRGTVAKYSDVGNVEGYIENGADMALGTVND